MTIRHDVAAQNRRWVVAALCFLSAGLLIPAQRQIDRRMADLRTDADILYFGSPKAVRMMALGYDSLIADFYWMRAIQYYGRRDEAERRPVRYKNLAALLEITTTLDPDLLDAFRAGSGFLAEAEPIGAGQPDEAIRLLERGIILHPSQWQLQFDKGFIYYWQFKDSMQAGRAWLEASKRPGSPPWMESLAAMGMSKGGAVETARSLWQHQYESSNRADVRENARNHLASIQIDEDIWALEFFIEKFRHRYHRFPSRLSDLVKAGILKSVPKDPSGISYDYDAPEGKVQLSANSKVKYLKVPYDYKQVYLQKLARIFGTP